MDLEAELGKKLFLRGNRRIILTEEGVFLRQRAQEIVDLADKTEAEFLVGGAETDGEVFIGGSETNGMRFLTDTMKRVYEKFPAIRFYLYSGSGEDISERLNKGLLDFGLFIGQVDLTKYDYMALPDADVWGLLLRQDDPLAAGEQIRPEDMRGVQLIAFRQAMIQKAFVNWLGFPVEDLMWLAAIILSLMLLCW